MDCKRFIIYIKGWRFEVFNSEYCFISIETIFPYSSNFQNLMGVKMIIKINLNPVIIEQYYKSRLIMYRSKRMIATNLKHLITMDYNRSYYNICVIHRQKYHIFFIYYFILNLVYKYCYSIHFILKSQK